MTSNPYQSPRVTAVPTENAAACIRRYDIAAIVVLLIALFLTQFLSLALPSIRYWFWPRFGDVAPLLLFPLVHLIPYLWRPSPKRLKGAAFMLLAIVAIVAAKIALIGPVPALPNALNDRLPFAYLWSIFTVAAMGVYVGWVAWTCRFQGSLEVNSVQNRG